MDVFGVHQQLIDDYRSFTTGVVDVRDPRIKQHVAEELARGEQWPEPWLSLKPMFASGGSIDELVGAGLLHEECARIFRPKRDQSDSGVRTITLHRHQRKAIEAASGGKSYVPTTGSHALDLSSPPEALMAEVGRLSDRIDHVVSGSAVSGRNPRRRRGSQPRPATP